MSYRPLPPSICIQKSPIHGMGLFAHENIEAGVNLGITHLKSPIDGLFPQNYCRTPLGGFYNHSKTPNAETYDQGRFIKLRAIQDIKGGEEITSYYRLYSLREEE